MQDANEREQVTQN